MLSAVEKLHKEMALKGFTTDKYIAGMLLHIAKNLEGINHSLKGIDHSLKVLSRPPGV